MKRKVWLPLLLLTWPAAVAPARASVIPLQPGTSVTVIFEGARPLKGRKPGDVVPTAVAQAVFTLDAAGRTLTVTLLNTSPSSGGAALYAFDFGLPFRVISRAALSAAASDFPAGAAWNGPTDQRGVTAGSGACVFAAREAVLGRFEDFLDPQTALPAGFLAAGRGGKITLTIEYPPASQSNAVQPLVIAPVAYFLAPGASAPRGERVQVAAAGSEKKN
jgi:hypothetical protein